MKYVPQPDYVQWCNDWAIIMAFVWMVNAYTIYTIWMR